MLLVVGLGNPGREYQGTRHNLGFEVVSLVAQRLSLSFEKERKWQADFVRGQLEEEVFLLLKPLTYMNESGRSVSAVSRQFQLDPKKILVIVDDVEIPFGKIRFRLEGGTAGHNGLKSVTAHLATSLYPRLKIGVGRGVGDLAEYVLSRFDVEEQRLLPELVSKAADLVELWIRQKLDRAMEMTVFPSNPSIGG